MLRWKQWIRSSFQSQVTVLFWLIIELCSKPLLLFVLFHIQQYFTWRSEKQLHVNYHTIWPVVLVNAAKGQCGLLAALHPAFVLSCLFSLAAAGGHRRKQIEAKILEKLNSLPVREKVTVARRLVWILYYCFRAERPIISHISLHTSLNVFCVRYPYYLAVS